MSVDTTNDDPLEVLPPPDGSAQPVDDQANGLAADPTDAPDVGRSFLRGASKMRIFLTVMQVALALAVVATIVVAPDDVSDLVARLAGIALVVAGAAALAQEFRHDTRSTLRLVGWVGVVVAGLFLVVDSDRWLTPVGRVAGSVIAVTGLTTVVTAVRSRPVMSHRRRIGAIAVVAGLTIFLFAEPLFEQLAIIGVLLAAATALLRTGVSTGVVELDSDDGASRRPLLVRWVDYKGKTPQQRDSIYEQVFFEGERAPARIGRFFLMMLFASVISAAGVLSDSTAVVIGAMLVAPLISPMMGMGLSLVTGWPNRLGRSTLIVLGGIAIAVGTGALLAASGIPFDLVSNTQIVSRSSPRLVDLVIAVAAGAAGAYAISRKDASSSLPGVAVAIALVPPLSVLGITMQAGDWEQAAGTLLLFLTNLVAIILAGGVVFVLTGVVPIRRFAENQHRVRTSFGAVAVLALLVVAGLVLNGQQIAQDVFAEDDAQRVVKTWLGDETEFEIVTLTVDDGAVALVLAGPGNPPTAQTLVADLSESLGTDIELDLQWIPRQRVVVTSD